MNELSTKEVAERIGVSPSTVKNWAARLPIPHHKDSQGNLRYPADEALPILETIKGLREEQRGYETIRRVIVLEPGPSQADDTPETGPSQASARPEASPLETAAIVEAVTASVVQAIQGQTEQGEKYARATYRVGELEATVKALEAERERLAGELADARQQIALLAAPKPARPWWRPWG